MKHKIILLVIGLNIFFSFLTSKAIASDMDSKNFGGKSCDKLISELNENFFAGNISVLVYPNPGNDHVIVGANGSIIQSLKIINFLGQIMLQMEPKSTRLEIDLLELQPGIYFIQLQINNILLTKRLEIIR